MSAHIVEFPATTLPFRPGATYSIHTGQDFLRDARGRRRAWSTKEAAQAALEGILPPSGGVPGTMYDTPKGPAIVRRNTPSHVIVRMRSAIIRKIPHQDFPPDGWTRRSE